jgi:hypothetical protein
MTHVCCSTILDYYLILFSGRHSPNEMGGLHRSCWRLLRGRGRPLINMSAATCLHNEQQTASRRSLCICLLNSLSGLHSLLDLRGLHGLCGRGKPLVTV